MNLQDNRDGAQKQMDEVKIETTKALNVMTRKINEGKKVHDDLTKEVKNHGTLRIDNTITFFPVFMFCRSAWGAGSIPLVGSSLVFVLDDMIKLRAM